jgi:galactose-1-phosphate uridylyltransferase
MSVGKFYVGQERMIARNYSSYYNVMPDGTVKQVNPFTGTEVWSVVGRGNKPISNGHGPEPKAIGSKPPRANYCSFCETRYFETPPEKARLIKRDGEYEMIMHLPPDQYEDSVAEFRRTGNMFEIVTVDYWKKNYGYRLTNAATAWRDAYIGNNRGAEHINAIINFKLRQAGKTEEQIRRKSQFDKLHMADAFFGGCHELIIAKKHYLDNAEMDNQLYSSGEMTREEHYQYFKFTIDAMRDILEYNRYVRYISVFQNWLRPAGASVDHLHKQIVGLDEWGALISDQIQMVRQDPNVFNELGANFAAQYNLVFAENDYAIAFVGIGHRFPTIEIYSKSYYSRPYEHTEEELRGFSSLVHACHSAMGSQISCNEEWYYTPVDAVYKIPWHVLLKWRINVPAGFEGGTNIYINPITPIDLRDKIVPRFYQLRSEGKIENFPIAEECNLTPNPLKYYLK